MPRRAAAKKPAEPNSTTVVCFVPRGNVNGADILKVALLGADVPIEAINVKPKIASVSDVKTDESGTEGRDYTVAITWEQRTPRFGTDKEDEPTGTTEQVLANLDQLTHEKIRAVMAPEPTA